MPFYYFKLLLGMFFISKVTSSEFTDSPVLPSPYPNDYKIQIAGVDKNGHYIRDISNEEPKTLSSHNGMKSSLYNSIEEQDSKPEFFDNGLQKIRRDELRLEYQLFYGKNHEYISSESIILYKCFLPFAQKIRIVAPKIHIGDCFFIPSVLSVSIIFECPDEIDSPLRSIEVIARDNCLSEEEICAVSNRCPKLKDICNGTALEDHSLHFEGWIDFTCYRDKNNAIFLTIDKNWLVKFNFRP